MTKEHQWWSHVSKEPGPVLVGSKHATTKCKFNSWSVVSLWGVREGRMRGRDEVWSEEEGRKEDLGWEGNRIFRALLHQILNFVSDQKAQYRISQVCTGKIMIIPPSIMGSLIVGFGFSLDGGRIWKSLPLRRPLAPSWHLCWKQWLLLWCTPPADTRNVGVGLLFPLPLLYTSFFLQKGVFPSTRCRAQTEANQIMKEDRPMSLCLFEQGRHHHFEATYLKHALSSTWVFLITQQGERSAAWMCSVLFMYFWKDTFCTQFKVIQRTCCILHAFCGKIGLYYKA